MPPDDLLPFLIGPYGALVLSLVVLAVTYRLFREERQEGKEDRDTVRSLAEAVRELTSEFRAWREAQSLPRRR